MSLKDRLGKSIINSKGIDAESSSLLKDDNVILNKELRDLKEKLHSALIEKVNITPSWNDNSDEEQKELIKQFVENQLLTAYKAYPLNKYEQDKLVKEIIQEAKGFGPLDPLLEDSLISDILVNGYNNVYVEKDGKLYKTNIKFKDNNHLRNIIERIVSKVGRRIDEKSPMVDARLPDGSRVNAIIPPLAIDGPSLSIRKFKDDVGSLESLLKWGSITTEIAEILKVAVKSRINIIVSGGTGAGKTTLLNSLSAEIPNNERIITIEDSAELSLKQDHVVRLETRPPNIEGEGQITTRDLVANALRMRPDRIIIGECRGAETLDMLQAMNTGHEGSLTTLHANSPRDALSRLETMVLYSGIDLPEKNIKSQISSSIELIIQVSRLADGSRKLVKLTEIVGMEGTVISLQDIFVFEQKNIENNKVIGEHISTGLRPKFIDKCASKGLNVDLEYFNKNHKHTYLTDNQLMQQTQSQQEINLTSNSIFRNRLIQQNKNISSRL